MTLLTEDFNDGVADGWSTCRGCAGLGCPRVSSASYYYPGDWNKPCVPVRTLATDRAVRFEFTVQASASMNLIAVRRLGTNEEGVGIDLARGIFDYSRLVGSWVTDHTATVTVPARPTTNRWTVIIDRVRSQYSVAMDGRVLVTGTALVGSLDATSWGLDLYGSSAVVSSVDDVVVSVLR